MLIFFIINLGDFMKYCNKCGKPLDPKEKFCSGCGNKIQEVKKETVKATKELTNTEIDEANKLGYISLGLYFALPLVGWIFNFFLSIFSALFPPLAILSLFSLLTS